MDRRRKKGVSPVTLKKEVATVRACWNWAVHAGVPKGAFPGKGLRFPKEEEKEPFRTFAEIEAVIAAEDPDGARQDTLWEDSFSAACLGSGPFWIASCGPGPTMGFP